MKLLVANRGEIASRIIASARAYGAETVAAFAEPDATAPFVREAGVSVRLGPAELTESYLSVDAYLRVARTTGATAVHPGYGFLSENASFAQAVIDAGLTWVGPAPTVIAQMGAKTEARACAVAADVPVVPGYAEPDASDDDLKRAAAEVGYPVLLKASAGGGGRGIRVVNDEADFDEALASAKLEAARAFGDDTMLVERFVARPRHIEVQLLGDSHGRVAHLGTRECSTQRRFQKLIEEAPAAGLPSSVTAALCDAAVRLGESIGYENAGTVEFVVDAETNEFFFLEVNTRLQVEHTVTEEVTGVDIVAAQLALASGQTLGQLGLESVGICGHAIEVRVNAESPANEFAPRTGRVDVLAVPADVRFDTAVAVGTEVTSSYDPMIGKLVVVGPDRPAAITAAAGALERTIIGPLETNLGFARWLLGHADFAAGDITNRWVDDLVRAGELGFVAPDAGSAAEAAGAAAAAAAWWRHLDGSSHGGSRGGSPGATQTAWSSLRGFRLVGEPARRKLLLSRHGVDAELLTVPERRGADEPDVADDASELALTTAVNRAANVTAVNVDGHTLCFNVLDRSQAWSEREPVGWHAGDALTAPFTAAVVEVAVIPGDRVKAQDKLVVLEAMKMLHTLVAPSAAMVSEVHVDVGDSVETDDLLVSFTQPDTQPDPRPNEEQESNADATD